MADSVSCGLPESGGFTYQDDYGIIYKLGWETTPEGLDITSVIQDPRVPGQPNSGYKVGHAVYRRGVVSVERQIIAEADGGYAIVSSGGYQSIEVFQYTFPCGPRPTDPFCHHLDNMLADAADALASTGPRWADPSLPGDSAEAWGSVAADGSVSLPSDAFEWVSVW